MNPTVQSGVHPTHAPSGQIGPNAIIRTVQALTERYGEARTHELLRRVGHAALITSLPAVMIDEQEFLALMQSLRKQLGLDETGAILQRAGELTAGYVIGNRIPGPVKLLLKLLPRSLSLRILCSAIQQHAWTFVGSGEFHYRLGRNPQFSITNCIEARQVQAATPICHFYQAAFETMLRTLIDPRTCVEEIACCACGGDACVFRLTFDANIDRRPGPEPKSMKYDV
ncbi:MAG: bacteriochlorophyll 4-vinyl reductase [Chloroflexaceae bacterium]|nr:bacteriochlorophyll 4-vinyl reductase [Chloroflexaceae bacterium]